MYNNRKKEEEKGKETKKALKPPSSSSSQNPGRSSHQRLSTGDSHKNKEDEENDRICNIIKEHLQKQGYTRTVQALNSDRMTKRAAKHQQPAHENTDSLVPLFEKGSREEFFKLLNRWFQGTEDIEFKKLEFELNIYFYIYSIHPEFRKSPNVTVDNASIECFKKYLETKGSDLSRTTEYLSFYALPYIQKPQEHPSISHVFTKEWLVRLKHKLLDYLKTSTKTPSRNQKLTTLQSLLRMSSSHQEEKKQCGHDMEIEQLRQQNQSLVEHINCMQENFKSVSDASKANIMDSQGKWFLFAKEIVVLARKALKGEKVEIKVQKLQEFFNKDIEELFATKEISIFDKNSTTVEQVSSISPLIHSISPGFRTANQRADNLIPLDSAKILAYLADCDKPENEIGSFLVLQALRWRFTKLKSPYLRREVIVNYSLHDLCVVLKPNWKTQDKLLFKSPTRVRVCYLRLLNYITSDYVGINYFNKEPYLISNLIKVFKEERDDTSVKKHSLGVLQKLSLLRQPQEIMLREGILEEIIHLLHQPDLSDYNVQYLTALLMNLSLRKLGKPKLEEHTTQLVQLIYDYLMTENIQVKNYINGTLYSFLEISPAFKVAALKIGMTDRVNDLVKDCEQNLFIHQYELILQKLNNKEATSDDNTSEEDDDELDYDDIDEEEENALLEDDKESECFDWEDEYLSGEELLMKEFPLLGPDGMKDQIMTKSAIEENRRGNVNMSSISKSRRGDGVFAGRPVTPSLNGIDNDLERSLLKYSKM